MQIVVFPIDLEGEAIVPEAGKHSRRHGVIKRRHRDSAKLPLTRLGDLEQCEILEVHVAIGNQPGEEGSLEDNEEIFFRCRR